jgi:hypothetical protein
MRQRGLRTALIIGAAVLVARALGIDLGCITAGDTAWSRLAAG